MAVSVIRSLVGSALSKICLHILGHSGSHLVGDISDHLLGALRQGLVDADNGSKSFCKGFFVTLAYTRDAALRIGEPFGAKLLQLLHLQSLLVLVGFHVVLDRVKRSEDEVEDRYVKAKAARKLPDHNSKGSRDLVEHFDAKCNVFVRAVHRVLQCLLTPEELEPDGRHHLQGPHKLIQLGGRVRDDLAVSALLCSLGAFRRLPTAKERALHLGLL
mmetsp:Transcript_3550/g.8337  ORF Transcript_3550/g.8337 Transcript_3550/m.8337 type:complete len:216 (-) Transcript_3550:944-1591(-)